MSFFKKSKTEPEITPPIPIGERFKYLGIEMVCARHFYYPYEFPVVVGEYISNHGKIEQAIFCPVDWEALKKEAAR